jgi:hypothetical protein
MVHSLLANHYYYNSFQDNGLDYAKTGNTSNYLYASDLFSLFNFNFKKTSDGNNSTDGGLQYNHHKNPYLKNLLKKNEARHE